MHRHSYTSSTLLSSLRSLELGAPPAHPLLDHALVQPLLHLRHTDTLLHPITLPDSQPPLNRKPYIHSVTPTPDHALLCLATNASHLQIHEPSHTTTPSHRLTLHPKDSQSDLPSRWLRVSSVTWLYPYRADTLLVAYENRDEAWLFDLVTCRLTKPTMKFFLRPSANLPVPRRGARDLACLSANTFACATGNELLRVFDVRAGIEPVGTIHTGVRDMHMCSEGGLYLYVGGEGCIRMLDSRVMDSGCGVTAGMISFGGQSARKRCEIGRAALGGDIELSWMGVTKGGVPGVVVYQTACGGVGCVDVGGGGATQFVPEGGEVLENRAWYVRRRGCEVLAGRRGWVVLAPRVRSPGVRVLEFRAGGGRPLLKASAGERSGLGTVDHSTAAGSVEVLKRIRWGSRSDRGDQRDWICVYGVGGGAERLVLGGVGKTVETLQVDLSGSVQREGEE